MSRRVSTIFTPMLGALGVSALVLLLGACKDAPTNHQNTNQWELLGLEGKMVHNLTLAGNYLYASAGRDGLFRLALSGTNDQWEYLGLADTTLVLGRGVGVTSVLADEATGRIMAGYADQHVIGHGIWITDDQGLTWAPSDSGIFVSKSTIQSLYRLPSQADTLFAGLSATIFKSVNGGISWELIWGNPDAGGLGINVITSQPDNSDYLMAGLESGRFAPMVLKSYDMGQVWQMLYQEFPLGPPNHQVDNAVYDITIHPQDPNIFYVGMIGMLLKTTDGGESWTKVIDWADGVGHHEKISINPNNSRELLATGIWLHHSMDGGATWDNIDAPVPDQNAFFALAVDWEQRVLYVSLSYPGFGIYRRTF